MGRPTTKEQLKQAGEDNFRKLLGLIDSIPIEQQEKPFSFEDRDKNIRDVLVHLYEWHLLFINWVKSNRAGVSTNFLPEPYNWKTYPKMNLEFWQKHQVTPLEKAKSLLLESHSETMKLIDSFTNEELFTKKHFSWTGTTSLGSYSVSATASHYEWGIKKIRRAKGLGRRA